MSENADGANGDLLATLRRLDAEASPGPWKAARYTHRIGDMEPSIEAHPVNNAHGLIAWFLDERAARLAALAHELLPLVEALPDANKLETLATWLDLKFPEDAAAGHDEVQRDLRIWARQSRDTLARIHERVAALGDAP